MDDMKRSLCLHVKVGRIVEDPAKGGGNPTCVTIVTQ
jgi:hypothetical protein